MPEWVGDLADLLQIFEFLFVVLTTGLGWLLSRTLPREAPPPATGLRAELIRRILRPDVQVEQDALNLAGLYVLLIAAVGVFGWVSWGPSFAPLRLLQIPLSLVIVGFAWLVTLLTARLFWKYRYLKQNEP